MMFNKGYMELQCFARVLSHCDVYQVLRCIVTFIKGFVLLRGSSRVMSHCDIGQGFCHIVTLVNYGQIKVNNDKPKSTMIT